MKPIVEGLVSELFDVDCNFCILIPILHFQNNLLFLEQLVEEVDQQNILVLLQLYQMLELVVQGSLDVELLGLDKTGHQD